MEIDTTNRSLAEVRLMITILNTEIPLEVTPPQIARACKISVYHPKFYKLIKAFIKLGILVEVRKVAHITQYRLDRVKLKDYLDEQDVVNYWYGYFNRHHKCIW